MFQRRAAALESGNTDNYLAPLSDLAKQVERPIADGAKAVPSGSWKLTLAPEAQPGSEGLLNGADVDLSYRYEGLPEDNVFRIRLNCDLVRGESGWQVANSRIAGNTRLPIWATGPVQTARSRHFLAMFRAGLQDAGGSLQLAEDARNELSPKLTLPLESAHLMLLARNRTEYVQFSARESPDTAIAHFESTYSITPEGITTEGRQIIVNLAEMSGRENSIETFVHELGHLALSPQTRPFTPAWITESSAMFLADTRPTGAWRQGERMGRFDNLSFVQLSRATSLGSHDPTGVAGSFEYAYSAAAGYYLIETFGAPNFWKLYAAFSDVSPSTVYSRISTGNRDVAIAELAAEITHSALARIYGIDESELDRRVRQWIEGEIS